jgi:hypothetical protein
MYMSAEISNSHITRPKINKVRRGIENRFREGSSQSGSNSTSLKAVFSDVSNENLMGEPRAMKLCLSIAARVGVEIGVP